MKKQLAIILCLVMLMSIVFAGCDNAPATPKTIVGKWEGQIDISDALTEQLAAGDASLSGLSFSDLTFGLTMTFNEDGTCVLAINEADVEQLFNDLMDQMMPVLSELFEEMYGMSLDDLIATSGMSEDAFMEMLMEQALAEVDLSELNMEGNYKAENGKLYISSDPDEEIDTDDISPNPYMISGNTLTIEANDEVDDESAFIFPLVLTWVD